MSITQSKATLFALGLASWSVPYAAFAVGEPAVAIASSAPLTAREILSQKVSTGSVLALASAVPLSDGELENARGGFSVGGINFNFGASVQTLVNGQLALQTNVQWTSAGAVVTQLQGLGTSIQNQVASNLANAGINVPATNGSAGPASNTGPVSSADSNVPSTVQGLGTTIQNQVASTLANAGINVPTTSSPGLATGGTSPGSPAASNLPSTAGNIAPSGGSASPPAPSPPASTTTVPASFVNISPTTSGGSPTSSPVSSLISLSALQNSPGNATASPNAQPLTANSLVATVATAPPNNGNSSPSGAPNNASPVSNVAPASNSPAASVNNPTVLSGVQIQSPTGTTQVFANVANGQIQSLILNSASNQSIVQNTNIVLTIYNLASLQQLSAQHAMSMQLSNQLLAAWGFSGGR